ncbi:Cysteine-rich membrane protein 2 [Spironucleus salmonicida]|uniref:Cysteine-rich membrane protein 2 n=1 Tax=Spironucleus salmonicida TaxID=348837 RepID=V6LQQ2_9EUKA|nr:Cysteine-rich membrane protein 2 [Spironucleus salmonicida]|eukprot:EST46578.1 Cysteine-rich membrane protein 2 [Spironucleus salmonicida]
MIYVFCIFVSNRDQLLEQIDKNKNNIELYNDIAVGENLIIGNMTNLNGNNFTLYINELVINNSASILISNVIIKQIKPVIPVSTRQQTIFNNTHDLTFDRVQFENLDILQLINTSYGVLTFKNCIFLNSVFDRIANDTLFSQQFINTLFLQPTVNFHSQSPYTVIKNSSIFTQNLNVQERISSSDSIYSISETVIINSSLDFNSTQDLFSLDRKITSLLVSVQDKSSCNFPNLCKDRVGTKFNPTDSTLSLTFKPQNTILVINYQKSSVNQTNKLGNFSNLFSANCSELESGFLCKCAFLYDSTGKCSKSCETCNGICEFTSKSRDFDSVSCKSCTTPFTNFGTQQICLNADCELNCSGHTCSKAINLKTFYSCKCAQNTTGIYCETCPAGFVKVGNGCFKQVLAGGECYLKQEIITCNSCDSGLVLRGGACVMGLNNVESGSLSFFVLILIIFIVVLIMFFVVLFRTKMPKFLTHKPDRNVHNDGGLNENGKKGVSLNVILEQASQMQQ